MYIMQIEKQNAHYYLVSIYDADSEITIDLHIPKKYKSTLEFLRGLLNTKLSVDNVTNLIQQIILRLI